MALFTLFAAMEASILSASWFQRSSANRRELLHGKETKSLCLPIVDKRLAREVDTATRFQTFVAERITAVCRRVVHTRAFELCVLRLIQSTMLRLCQKSGTSSVEAIQ
jgi:hypothetical protein